MIRAELARQWRRPRTLLVLLAVALFPAVLIVALAVLGANNIERVGDVPLYFAPSGSGFTLPLIALSSTMKFFLPLAVAIFAGEAVAGEAGWGTLRYELARPISRTRYLASKLTVALGLSAVAVLVLVVVALALGVVAWGWHPFVVTNGSSSVTAQSAVTTFSTSDALAKLAVGTAYVLAGMVSILAFAFFLSTVTSRPAVAVAGGIGLTILSRVLNADYVPGVSPASSYMPNNDIDLWQRFFVVPTDTSGMPRFLVLQAVYAGVFLLAAWLWFRRRDILV